VWNVNIGPTNQNILTNSARLEVYSLTKTLLSFFSNKINVGALRAIILPARTSGETDWVTYIIKAAFGKFGFVYDTDSGAPSFGCTGNGGNYNLSSWAKLVGTGWNVNCYDQAGIVQIGLGLGLNGASTWKYMKPYGFINTTDLIGVGTCNNPFYTSNNTKAVIGNNDANRTAFGNHAFISVTSKNSRIADACAGPHLATESLSDYVDASIEKAGNTDTTTTLYSTYPQYGPGTKDDAKDKAGVTSIDGSATSSSSTSTDKTTASFKATMAKAVVPLTGNAGGVGFTNVDLSKIHNFLTQSNGFSLFYHSYDVSANGSTVTWYLKSGAKLSKIEIVILSTAEDAKNHFQNHLTGYQRPLDEVLVSAPGSISKGELCLVSPPEHQSDGRMVWVRGNVFAHVSAPISIQDLDKTYLKSIDSVFVDGTQAQVPGQAPVQLKPEVKDINAPKQVSVGQEFTVYASVDGSTHSSVDSGKNDVIVLLSADNVQQAFNFRAEKAGKQKLLFAFAHTVTGLVATKEIEVTVV